MLLILEKLMALAAILLLCLCMAASVRRTEFARRHPSILKITGFHTICGILLPAVGLLHGILAGRQPGMASGKLVFLLLMVLLFLNLFRKKMRPALWKRLHRRLAVLVCALTVVHIIWALVR